MTDEQFLLLIFGALYLAECLEWLPRWYAGFSSVAGRNWRVRRPSRELGNASAGLLWKFPLPPLGTFVASQPLPFAVGNGGVLACALHSPNPGGKAPAPESFATWQELGTLRRDGKQLLVGGRTFLKVCSEREAAHLARLLGSLADAPAAERERIAHQRLRRAFALESARRRLDAFRRASRPLRILCNLLFVLLFACIPPVVWYWGFEDTWPYLLVALLAFMLSCATVFHSLHRRLFPLGKGERWTNALLACVAPHHAIRLVDAAARGLLSDFHPLACARLLLDPADFRDFAARWYRDLKFPISDASSDFVREKAATRSWWIAETSAFLERCGLDEKTLLASPIADDTNGSFCPRCHTAFELRNAVCADCGGMRTCAALRR